MFKSDNSRKIVPQSSAREMESEFDIRDISLTTPRRPKPFSASTSKITLTANRIPCLIKVLGVIWSVIMILNGVWAFLMNYYVSHDSGNREVYFELTNVNLKLSKGLRIRALYLDVIPEENVPMIYTDDRGWYKRINQHLKETDEDKIILSKINGYMYLVISGYFLVSIWSLLGILDIFKFRKTNVLLNVISFFFQITALIIESIAYYTVFSHLNKFRDLYKDLFDKCKCSEVRDKLEKSATHYILYDIPCLVIPIIHLVLSFCYTFGLYRNKHRIDISSN